VVKAVVRPPDGLVIGERAASDRGHAFVHNSPAKALAHVGAAGVSTVIRERGGANGEVGPRLIEDTSAYARPAAVIQRFVTCEDQAINEECASVGNAAALDGQAIGDGQVGDGYGHAGGDGERAIAIATNRQ